MIGPTTSKQASGQICVTAEDESCSHWCYSRRYCRRHNEAVHCCLPAHDSSAVTSAVLLLHCCSAANAASGTMKHRMPQLPQGTTCTWPVNAHKASTTTLPYRQPGLATTQVVEGSRAFFTCYYPATRLVELYLAYYPPTRVVARPVVRTLLFERCLCFAHAHMDTSDSVAVYVVTCSGWHCSRTGYSLLTRTCFNALARVEAVYLQSIEAAT
jgi:hypothetical protein